jgi:putative glutamine amidotransferase
MPEPLIALTATTRDIGGIMRLRLNEDYVEAVRSVGLVPLIMPPRDPAEADGLLDHVAGVVLTGGEDVDPSEYGAETSPKTYPPHRLRDAFELAVARRARERRLPTLAICRGIQLVNVALGGTLVQDIATERPSSINHEQSELRDRRVHDIEIVQGSRLAHAVGTTRISVNSSHHQAVAQPANGLRLTARAPDGVIEAAEWSADDWWMLAVQWHPEELVHDAESWDRALFEAFANRVKQRQPASFQRTSSST